MMTTLATYAFVLLALCATPALADSGSPPRALPMKVQLTVRDAAVARSFDIVVGPDTPCATANSAQPDLAIDLKACASHDARLTIEWSVHSASGEYRSTSTIPFERGGRAELGSTSGPRLAIAIQ